MGRREAVWLDMSLSWPDGQEEVPTTQGVRLAEGLGLGLGLELELGLGLGLGLGLSWWTG